MATIDIGKIKPVFKGTYDNSTAYVLDDIVYYNGSSYVAKTSTTGNLPTDTTKWNVLASGSGGVWDSTLSIGSAGQVVKVNSGATALEFGDAGGGLQSIQSFTSSGTYTKPSGINKIKVYVTGAGGGGGGQGTNDSDAGGGGGAGGTAIEILDATSITTVTVTIGTGGGGGTGANDGSSGGTSSFGSYCSATGGQGGREGNAGGVYGGNGGIGSNGDLNLRGACGEGGFDGSTSWQQGGLGGSSFFGGGGRGSTGNTNAVAGVNGGGGGAGSYFNTNRPGASGGDGIIVVEEYK